MTITYDRLQLSGAILQAFQTYEGLSQFINNKCSKDLNLKTHAVVGLESVCMTLLDWADKDNWIENLLVEFMKHDSKDLRDAATLSMLQLKQSQPVFPAAANDPFGVLFLSRRACFIGRDDFRAALREMQKVDAEFKVLLIGGEKNRGKTYSYELIRKIKLLPENIVERIDFKNFRAGALAQRYADIANQINIQLEIPADRMPPRNESDTKWFEHAIRKFDYVAGKMGKRLWLVFDHVPSWEERGEQLSDALTKIVEYTCQESDHLRVVIIDIHADELLLQQSTQLRVSTNTAALPTKEDIASFLKAAGNQVRISLDAAQLDSTASCVITDLKQAEEDKAPFKLSEVTWNYARKLNIVE